MKILHVSESDSVGGAAIAASRMNSLLTSYNIDSNLLVNRKKSNDLNVVSPTSFIDKLYAKLMPHLIIRLNKFVFGTNNLSVFQDVSADFF